MVSPWALYFSGWYPATLDSTYLHEMMHVHLVLVGCLFFWPIVGVDPVPGKVGYPFRMLLVVLTLPFHAFLGVTIMAEEDVIGGDHYADLHDGPMGSLAAGAARRPAPRRRASSGARATWSRWCSSACCSCSGCGSRCRRPSARTGAWTCSRRENVLNKNGGIRPRHRDGPVASPT